MRIIFSMLLLLIPFSTHAQDCSTKTDEFTGNTTTTCDVGRIQVEEQPTHPLSRTDLFVASQESMDSVILGLTTVSETWNFLDHDTAYALINGDRFEFKIIKNDGEVASGRVVESTGVEVNSKGVSSIAKADTFRLKIGTAVFNLEKSINSIKEISSK